MMRAQGIQPCPIFDLPGVGLDIICIDVLHCLDLGFTQDVLGNIFLEYLGSGLCTGANQDARAKSLWEQLKVQQKLTCYVSKEREKYLFSLLAYYT